MARAYNFYPGPAVLPLPVLEKTQQELLDWENTGTSVMETSHRSPEYESVHHEVMSLIKEMLSLGEEYHVLLLQGGASLQFAMVPMNLLAPGEVADYIHTGAWSKKAVIEARILGQVNLAFDGETVDLRRIPNQEELRLTPGAAYVHVTSNNTIKGTQFHTFPRTGDVPMVCDMSSDFLSRSFDPRPFGIIYAGAQKNLGPAGVTVVIIRDDILDRCRMERVPTLLRYRTHVESDSLFNTPPCFNIYVVRNVLKHMMETGGLPAMEARNREKARKIYDTIDQAPEFFRAPVDRGSRSLMNIVFRLPAEELEDSFVSSGREHGLLGLKGHRSVGGIRISVYNSCPMEAVDKVVYHMQEFAQRHG